MFTTEFSSCMYVFMGSEEKKIYEFGEFRFDAECLQLEHAGQFIKIPPKSLETLKILLEQSGKTVSRENLLQNVWNESFVEDANLTVAVSTLRKTLAVYEPGGTYIQTVPNVGYRFVANVKEKFEIDDQSLIFERHSVEEFTVEENLEPQKTKSYLKSYALLFTVPILLMLIAAFFWQGREKSYGAGLSANQAAFGAYQKGNALLQKRQVCESISYFQEAVANDKNFAEAFASLGASQAMCAVKGEAEENVARSIALEPNLAQAHATDGFIRMFRHWDWAGAENSLRRAVALDPNSAQAHHWLGVYLSIRGRLGEAKGEMARAIEIEPNSPLYLADMGQVLYFNRDYDLAADYCRKSLALDPKFFFATQYLRDIYLLQGNEAEAIKFEIENVRNFDYPEDSLAQTKERLEKEGFKNYWQLALDGKLARWSRNEVKAEARSGIAYGIANRYLALGDRENALKWFAESVKISNEGGSRLFFLPYLNVDPRYDQMRDDVRFQEILRKMNLVE